MFLEECSIYPQGIDRTGTEEAHPKRRLAKSPLTVISEEWWCCAVLNMFSQAEGSPTELSPTELSGA